jgi:hypothetical protein
VRGCGGDRGVAACDVALGVPSTSDVALGVPSTSDVALGVQSTSRSVAFAFNKSPSLPPQRFPFRAELKPYNPTRK